MATKLLNVPRFVDSFVSARERSALAAVVVALVDGVFASAYRNRVVVSLSAWSKNCRIEQRRVRK
jgi:hypothetical protein